MATLRELLVGNIEDAKANVAKLEADLARMDAEGGGWLEREVGELQQWLQGLAAHVFSKGAVAPPAVVVDQADAPVEPTVVSASATMTGTGQLGGPVEGEVAQNG